MDTGESGTARITMALMVVLAIGCQAQKEPLPSTLEIVSEPEGADVQLSGKEVGITPVTVRDVTPGHYVVRASRPGFKTWFRTVEVRQGGAQTVRVRLERETAFATVESTPAQARFYHEDGTLLGVTPFNDYVPAGQYRMRFSKDHYEDTFVDVDLVPDGTARIVAELRGKRARIMVSSDPRAATIYIDELERGRRTPATLEVEPGLRTVGVALAGYSREERDLEVKPDTSIEVHFDLVPGNVPAGMVKVPASEFIMGCDTESPDERPRRKVFVPTFFIDKHEITNIRYQRFDPTYTFPPELASHPVVNVTWHEAVAYAEWAGKRLPTEAEWEKAARGETGRLYPWGNTFNDAMCNVAGTLASLLKSVGQFPEGRSPYGCYDMAGNVWEWVEDWYAPYPGNLDMRNDYGQQVRVIRGGAYTESAFHARCANRDYERPNVGRPDIGFRCAKSPRKDGSDEEGSE